MGRKKKVFHIEKLFKRKYVKSGRFRGRFLRSRRGLMSQLTNL